MPILDFWGQEIKNGDFVISASKTADDMVMSVMKDVSKQTRMKITRYDEVINGQVVTQWNPAEKVTKMYTLARTLKLNDEYIARFNPDLFDVMNDVREKLSLPTNRNLKHTVNTSEDLKRLLRGKL